MKLEIFTLCDAATNQAGKLNILGTFDTLLCATVPYVHERLSVALRVRYARIEEGEHQIRFALTNTDGKILAQADAALSLTVPGDAETGTINLVMDINKLRVEQFGEHMVDVAVDRIQISSLPLHVKQVPPAP